MTTRSSRDQQWPKRPNDRRLDQEVWVPALPSKPQRLVALRTAHHRDPSAGPDSAHQLKPAAGMQRAEAAGTWGKARETKILAVRPLRVVGDRAFGRIHEHCALHLAPSLQPPYGERPSLWLLGTDAQRAS